MLETTAPILPARDLSETSTFYQKLGFMESGHWPNRYLIIVRDKVELHFFHHPDLTPEKSNHAAYIRTGDVDAYSNEVAELGLPDSGIPRFEPAEDKDWGMREMAIIDPNGTLIRIGQYM